MYHSHNRLDRALYYPLEQQTTVSQSHSNHICCSVLLCRIWIFAPSASAQQISKNPDGNRLYDSHLCTRDEAQPILSASTSCVMPCSLRITTSDPTTLSQCLDGLLCAVLDGIFNFLRCFKLQISAISCTIECACRCS